MSTRIPTSMANAAGTTTRRAVRETSAVTKDSSIAIVSAASPLLSHLLAAIQSPAPVIGSASDTWYAARVRTMLRFEEKIHSRPP